MKHRSAFTAICRVLVLAPVMMACVPVSQTSAPRMSLVDAETHCIVQANRYANRPLMIPDASGTIQVGLQAELPSQFYVNDYYKRCFRANAGQNPQTLPKLPAYG